VAGSGRSLADAFALLDQSPHVDGLLRHPKRDLLTARVALTPEDGQGYWELMRIRDEMFVILMNCAYKEPRLEWVPGDGLVQFNFKLSGDLTYGLTHRKPLRFNRPALHIWKQPRGVDIQEWTARNSHERMVAISVSPQFIQENFFAPQASIPAQLREFLAPAVDRIDFCQSALTSRMLELTTCLLDRAPNSLASLVYREALTLELLSLAITHFETLHQHPDSGYSERQLRSLSAARAILMKQFAPAPTLEQITRAVALPEKTLTRGFKALYGDTLFDFSIK